MFLYPLLAALPSTALIHADRVCPAFVAARENRAFSSCVTRNWMTVSAGFSTGGLPLGRLVMGLIVSLQIIVDNLLLRVLNVMTLNQEKS